MDKRYQSKEIEKKIYSFWEKNGFFNPDNQDIKTKSKKTFCILMPPPNANGPLHIGHAVFVTIEDILTRFWRMNGVSALWLPAFDHAGFETQVVFDKKYPLVVRELKREELLKKIWDFTQGNKKICREQLKSLGASADWSREKFTLDKEIVETVYETFEKLYKDKLLYRGERIVNWCTHHQTFLSELEVRHKEVDGVLWYVRYKLKTPSAKTKYIIVATTRPETILGDTAVAVNPGDKRYKGLIGKTVIVPLVNRRVPIVADRAVDKKFGTGAVKITPAHDSNDFKIAQRNSLPKIEVIDKTGKIKAFGDSESLSNKFIGLKISEARDEVIKELKELNLLEREEPYRHTIGVCYKCGRFVEYLPSSQWFIKIKPLAEKVIRIVKKDKIRFHPRHYKRIFLNWMKNIRDWNIGRQIIWGIRMPVWYRKIEKNNPKVWDVKIYGEDIFRAILEGTKKIETRAGRKKGESKYWGDFQAGDTIDFYLADEKTDAVNTSIKPVRKIVKRVSHYKTINDLFKIYSPELDYPGKTAEDIKNWWKGHPTLHARIKEYGIWAIELADSFDVDEVYVGKNPPDGLTWRQENDVFDTWFSSGQWPFAVLGYPDGRDFKKFYPTSVIETGWDILFFWVARMIMLSLYRTGRIPFRDVVLHGLVRDKDRQKMSKSKGNVIDPLAVVSDYGADALRIALVFGTSTGSDVIISEEKIRGQRNFTNKIWNASRFVMMNLKEDFKPQNVKPKLTSKDKWILGELKKTIRKITLSIKSYRFHRGADEVYQFFWHKFCDKTIEDCKKRIFESKTEKEKETPRWVLWTVLYQSLKILHPFMPFVSEEIYQKLPSRPKIALIIEEWPG
ncbi:MAG: class I tRNA ligase family protein [Patescibacteria group bacterium]